MISFLIFIAWTWLSILTGFLAQRLNRNVVLAVILAFFVASPGLMMITYLILGPNKKMLKTCSECQEKIHKYAKLCKFCATQQCVVINDKKQY
jgi:hypothetical protein